MCVAVPAATPGSRASASGVTSRSPGHGGNVIFFITRPHQPRRSTRRLVVAALAAAGLLGAAPAAHAADLLVLDSEQATLSGTQTYGFVYIDGDLRLTGDTTIKAASIYLGPNAAIHSCFVDGAGNDGCTNGRSLTLQSAGPLAISSGIDLTGGTGTTQSGGALVIQGAQVAVGGDINTTGNGGGASGPVLITSTGGISTGSIYAYGAAVNLAAAGAIDISGDVQTQGTSAIASPDGAHGQFGAPVTLASSGGDLRVDGNISTSGRDMPASGGAGLIGGDGAAVSLTGSDVRVGSIDTTGGTSADAAAGQSGPIALAARGSLTVLGRLDAGGQNSGTTTASPGARIAATSSARLVVAGGAWTGGAQGPSGATAGGDIVLQGGTIDTGTLYVPGANGPGAPAPHDGAPAGSVTVTATATASVAQILAYGGNGPTGTAPGRGGPVAVTSNGGSVATGRINSHGGYPNNGPGADGGSVTLSAQTDLTAGGSIDAGASGASGDADPPRAGGNAGNVIVRAATGTLVLGDDVRAEGGSGAGHPLNGHSGGQGGRGGRVDLVARTLGSIVSISSHGGNGGDFGNDQGGGGAGGAVYAWTSGTLFDDQRVVDTDGGSGHPVGASGAKVKELMPASLAIDPASGVLSFSSASPDASAYRVLRSLAGAAPEQVLETTKTAGLALDAPICVPVTFTVVAVNAALGWVSDTPAAVSYLRPPSASQQCADPPTLEATARLRYSKRKLRRGKWLAKLKLRSSGIGAAQITLVGTVRKGHRKPVSKDLATLSVTLAKAGDQALVLQLPAAARRRGSYTLRVVTTAPDGATRATNTLKLEVRT